MKKLVISLSILFLLLAILPGVFADEKTQVELAYECLQNRINQTGCSALSFEQKVFSLLAVGKCQDEIISENLSNQCWPKSGCRLKSTAQAILALNEEVNTTTAERWLLTQTSVSTEIDWFLEIESSEPTTCQISYQEKFYTLSIGADKKISATNLGNCLSLSAGAYKDYFLLISPSCYNMEIDISCDQSFITTLLFKKQGSGSNPLHILEKVHSASADEATTEKVDALCFSQTGICNYEGSLWATLILYYLDYDISPYIPYLLTMKSDNEIYLPESFLYFLTGKLKTDLLLKQIFNKYWDVSGERYYDTALALWPLYYDSPLEKQNSKNWLLSVQGADGCWNNNNIRDTAFILYSVWPEHSPEDKNVCGNNLKETGEQCDRTDLDGQDCSSYLGSTWTGDLSCNEQCNFNTSECEEQGDEDSVCGNDIKEPGEECDGIDLNNKSCQILSVYTLVGELFCNDDCTFNLSECYKLGPSDNETEEDCEDSLDCFSGYACIGGTCVEKIDCEDNGGYCMSAISCEGEILPSNYICSGIYKCCDTEKTLGECSGDICTSDEYCSGTATEASDLDDGEICCITGSCKISGDGGATTDDSCEFNNGVCRASCRSNEEETNFYTCDYGDVCCLSNNTPLKSYAWIWILLILILLTALGIVFRDKLRTQWMKIKSKFGGKPEGKRPGIFPMSPSQESFRRIPPRRILPPSRTHSPVRKPLQRKPVEKEKPISELDNVLKKLKDMGK